MLIRDVRIEFDDPETFLDAYEGKLSAGWAFIPSEDEFALGEIVEVTIDLVFCGHTARALSIVKSRISPALAKILDRPAGAVVEFADGIKALEEMLEDTIERLLSSSWDRADRSSAPRRHRRFEVAIPGTLATTAPGDDPAETEEPSQGDAPASGEAKTRNLSQSGALLEVPGLALECGQTISLTLLDPATNELVALSARVVRTATPSSSGGPDSPPAASTSMSGSGATSAREDAAPKAPASDRDAPPRAEDRAGAVTSAEREHLVAVEFTDTPDTGARKAAFLSRIRAITQGHTVGGISGNLAGLSLPSLLQSIATSSERGTMEIIGDTTEAHIFFASNEFRDAKMGRIHGVKVLARLMEWSEGEFYFHPKIEGGAPTDRGIPIERAVMEAVHQAEELRRLADDILPDTVLLERQADDAPADCSATEIAVLDLLERPACTQTILDALRDADFEIWRAITSLRERGLVTLREE